MSENKNMRELSLDEMDKVSGGSGTITVDGVTMGEAEFNKFITDIEKNWGTDVAYNFFVEVTGYHNFDHSGAGPDELVDLALNGYWKRCEREKDGF